MVADVHTRQLRYFLAVAESGSYRHAARKLFVTQPALSRSIKQLEACLGARLFDRSARGTKLTGAGFAIVEPARRLLESLDRATALIAPDGNATTTWRIAYAPESMERALGCLVRAITQSWPTQDYVCHEMPQTEVADAVMAGSCDLGLGIGSAAARPGLYQGLVGREPLAALVRQHAAMPAGPLSVDDLKGQVIVLPPASRTDSIGLFIQEELHGAGLLAHRVSSELPGPWRDPPGFGRNSVRRAGTSARRR